MRGFGIFPLIAGTIGAIAAMSMNVTVSTGFGTVNNVGLMSDRQNYLIRSSVAIIAGLLMLSFGVRHESAPR